MTNNESRTLKKKNKKVIKRVKKRTVKKGGSNTSISRPKTPKGPGPDTTKILIESEDLTSKGKYIEAIEKFNSALEKTPDNQLLKKAKKAKQTLITNKLKDEAEDLISKKKYYSAMEKLNEALKIDPDNDKIKGAKKKLSLDQPNEINWADKTFRPYSGFHAVSNKTDKTDKTGKMDQKKIVIKDKILDSLWNTISELKIIKIINLNRDDIYIPTSFEQLNYNNLKTNNSTLNKYLHVNILYEVYILKKMIEMINSLKIFNFFESSIKNKNFVLMLIALIRHKLYDEYPDIRIKPVYYSEYMNNSSNFESKLRNLFKYNVISPYNTMEFSSPKFKSKTYIYKTLDYIINQKKRDGIGVILLTLLYGNNYDYTYFKDKIKLCDEKCNEPTIEKWFNMQGATLWQIKTDYKQNNPPKDLTEILWALYKGKKSYDDVARMTLVGKKKSVHDLPINKIREYLTPIGILIKHINTLSNLFKEESIIKKKTKNQEYYNKLEIINNKKEKYLSDILNEKIDIILLEKDTPVSKEAKNLNLIQTIKILFCYMNYKIEEYENKNSKKLSRIILPQNHYNIKDMCESLTQGRKLSDFDRYFKDHILKNEEDLKKKEENKKLASRKGIRKSNMAEARMRLSQSWINSKVGDSLEVKSDTTGKWHKSKTASIGGKVKRTKRKKTAKKRINKKIKSHKKTAKKKKKNKYL